MPSQTQAGKAFEFALLIEAEEYLSKLTDTKVVRDSSYKVAMSCFDLLSEKVRGQYITAAKVAIEHINTLEPRLQHSISKNGNQLILQLVPDSLGIKGDVRDLLFIRSFDDWQIGISAKNNHKAIKHSRLSDKLDFGKEWLGLKCSRTYFDEVQAIFLELRNLKDRNIFWRDLKDKQLRFYLPILNSFKSEILRLDKEYPSVVSKKLMSYLIGNKDFYKVIKRPNKTEVLGFNLYGTLNKSVNGIRSIYKVNRLKLPTRIIELSFKPNSNDTLFLTCDEGW